MGPDTERCFRTTKSTLEVRPIVHHHVDTSIGHIVGCFLALRLEVDLQRWLDNSEGDVSWPDLMRVLGQVQAVTVELDGKHYRLRTDLVGAASRAFTAAGVRPPSVVKLLDPAHHRPRRSVVPKSGASVVSSCGTTTP